MQLVEELFSLTNSPTSTTLPNTHIYRNTSARFLPYPTHCLQLRELSIFYYLTRSTNNDALRVI